MTIYLRTPGTNVVVEFDEGTADVAAAVAEAIRTRKVAIFGADPDNHLVIDFGTVGSVEITTTVSDPMDPSWCRGSIASMQ